jgi:parallel beta-helix repeat protein
MIGSQLGAKRSNFVQSTVHRFIVISVVSILMGSSMGPLIAAPTEDTGRVSSSRNRAQDLPIIIDSDTELKDLALLEGWPGNGSSERPFTIEGMTIEGEGVGYCIYLGNVSAHVLIRGNTLMNATGVPGPFKWSCISLNNVSNGRVEENEILGSGSYGVHALGSSVNISRNNISHVAVGVLLERSEGRVVDNKLENISDTGIRILECESTTIRANTVIGFDSYPKGIMGYKSHNNRIEANLVSNVGTGIHLYISHHNFIWKNNISAFYDGIYLSRSDKSQVIENVVTAQKSDIMIWESEYGIFIRNELGQGGFGLDGTMYSRIEFDTHRISSSNTYCGNPVLFMANKTMKTVDAPYGQIILVNSTDIKIEDIVFPRRFGGIMAAWSERVILKNVTMKVEDPCDVTLIRCKEFEFLDSSFERAHFDVDGTQYTKVIDNEILNGSLQFHSPRFMVTGNHITTLSTYGIYSRWSGFCRIEDNIIEVMEPSQNPDDLSYSIIIDYSKYAVVNNNTLLGAPMRFEGSGLDHWNTHEFDDNNTFNGVPIRYFKNRTGVTVTEDLGQLFLANCQDFHVSNQTMDGGAYAISSGFSSRGTITRSRLTNGMYHYLNLQGCDNVSVTRNIFQGGHSRVYIYFCQDVDIENNYFQGISHGPLTLHRSYRVSVTGNGFLDIINTNSALFINTVSPSESLLTSNHFENCSNWAVHVIGTGTTAHHNFFVDCRLDDSGEPRDSQVYTSYPENEWDDGTEGNYWSDYIFWNPRATNDGITWNKPYVISSENRVQDDHPLIEFKDTVPPIAYAGSNITMAAGTPLELNGSGSIDNVGITSFRWTIGTVEKNGMKTSHTFDELGIVPVTLWVEDAAGLWDEVAITVRVIDGEPPVAKAGNDITVDQGTSVELNATNSTDNDAIKTYVWTLEYGGTTITRTRKVSSFRFDTPGEYLVTLTVTDRQGNTDNDTLVVRVLDTIPPMADAGPDIEIDEGGEAVLDGTNSSDNDRIVEHLWTMFVGNRVYQWMGPTARFSIPWSGHYEATLRVTDAYGNWDEDKCLITVNDTTSPTAHAGEDFTVNQGVIATFDSSGSSDNVAIRDWIWEFYVEGKGVELDGPYPSYVFEVVGTYIVTLVVRDGAGLWDEDDMMVTVLDTSNPVAALGVDTEFDQGETVELDGTFSTDNVEVTKWTWQIVHDKGEGTAEGAQTTYKFDFAGFYNVTLTVEDDRGNADTKSIIVRAIDTQPPTAVVPENPVRTKAGIRTLLDGSGSHDNVGVVEWNWVIQYRKRTYDLEGEKVEFKFDKGGRATITLTVKDAQGLGHHTSIDVIIEEADTEEDTGLNRMAIGAIITVIVAAVLLVLKLRLRGRET